MRTKRHWLIAALAALIGLGSLGVAETASAQRFRVDIERPQVRARVHFGGRVRVAPPPVRYEVRPPAPRADLIWQPGYWSYNGRQYVWVEGQYVPARRGYAWREPRWQQQSGYWVMVP